MYTDEALIVALSMFFLSLQPLVKISPSFRDSLLLVLRKSLFSRSWSCCCGDVDHMIHSIGSLRPGGQLWLAICRCWVLKVWLIPCNQIGNSAAVKLALPNKSATPTIFLCRCLHHLQGMKQYVMRYWGCYGDVYHNKTLLELPSMRWDMLYGGLFESIFKDQTLFFAKISCM